MGGATGERARFWRRTVDSYQMSVVSKSSVCDTSEVRFTRHKLNRDTDPYHITLQVRQPTDGSPKPKVRLKIFLNQKERI